MADQWFYARGGQQTGPVSFEQLLQLARNGGLAGSDLVWREGAPDWQPAGEVPGLFPATAAQPGTPAPTQPLGYSGPYQPPPQQYQQSYPAGSVPNYLAQSIIVTILCCWPLGIPAIVYAAQVNSKLASGDYQGAVAASNSAKMWSWIAFGLGLGVIAIYILLAIVASQM